MWVCAVGGETTGKDKADISGTVRLILKGAETGAAADVVMNGGSDGVDGTGTSANSSAGTDVELNNNAGTDGCRNKSINLKSYICNVMLL